MKTLFLPISSFCKTGSGTTPSRNKYDRYFNGSIPWVKSGELRESIIAETEERVTEEALAETSLKIAPKGAVLVAMYGANVGRVGILGINATTNQAICYLIPEKDKADSRYIFHALQQKLPEFISRSVGGAQPNISQQIIRETKILLPPLEEQRRISIVLDRAEELRSKRREAIAQLDTLTQAIFLEMFGDPVVNPKGWTAKALTQVCYCYSGGTPSKSKDAYWLGSLPWFSAKDLKSNDLFDSQDHISEEIPVQTTLKLLPANTVVIVVRGMILAHTFPISVLRVPATINQDLKALLPYEPLEPQFLAACLRSSEGFALQQVSEAAHGTKRLDAEGLRKIPIILPPVDLQREFARCVEAVERLKNAHHASLSELDALFACLQHRAFQGEL